MSAIELLIVVTVLLLAGAYWRKNAREHQKQCPECGAYVHEDEAVCKYCKYKFF